MLRLASLCVLLLALAIPAGMMAQGRPGGNSGGSGSNSGNRGPSSSRVPSEMPGNFPQMSEMTLVIHVVMPNDRPIGAHAEVQLMSSMGGVVNSYFTNPEGEVTFSGVRPGSYKIKVRGEGFAETTTDSFFIDPRTGSHDQWVRVNLDESARQKTSTQPLVSATELNAPDKAKKEFNKGNEAIAANDTKKALEHYNKAVEIYPRYGLAYNNIGAVYMHQNDREGALAAFEKAVEADPQLASANANLARLKIIEKKPLESLPFLERALATEPRNPEYLFLMSRAQLESEHYDVAIAYARKVHAQEDHKKFSGVHLVAGNAFEAQNKLADARVEYEIFLKESPDAPQAAMVRNAVNRLSAAAAPPAVR